MSLRAMVWAFEQIKTGKVARESARLVLLKLADRANDDGKCWPGKSRIGEDVAINSPTTVARAIKDLEAANLLNVEKRKDESGRDLSCVYHLKLCVGSNIDPRPLPHEPGGVNNCEGEGANIDPKPPKESINITTTNVGGGLSPDEIQEHLNAAKFCAAATGKKIKSAGYWIPLLQRLRAAGPSSQDLEDLKRWRHEQAANVEKNEKLEADKKTAAEAVERQLAEQLECKARNANARMSISKMTAEERAAFYDDFTKAVPHLLKYSKRFRSSFIESGAMPDAGLLRAALVEFALQLKSKL